ncbi:MAG: DUF3995 domain-containing protein [Euzebya sp.]
MKCWRQRAAGDNVGAFGFRGDDPAANRRAPAPGRAVTGDAVLMEGRTRTLTRTWPAYAAAVWALAFGRVSFYWAAGGHVGLGTLAETIREKALARDHGFILLIWVTGALKVVLAGLPLAIVRHWHLGEPRQLLRAGAWTN